MKRAFLAAATACGVILSTLSPAPASALSITPRCAPVHVLQAAGTGFSHSWDPSARTTLFDDGSSLADDLQRHYGTYTISTFQVPYPASLGRFSALGGIGVGINAPAAGDANDAGDAGDTGEADIPLLNLEGTEAATYGESVAIGRDAATAELALKAKRCPSTKFVLIGYSQGAHVMGDAAALAANHRVPGVRPEQIAAVLLVADPARSPARGGSIGANGERIIGGSSGIIAENVGMSGPRALPFTGLAGRVLSLCHAQDLACSTPPRSLVRVVADVAMRQSLSGPPNSATGLHLAQFAAALAGGASLPDALAASGLSLLDAVLLPQLIMELTLLFDAIGTYTATSPTPPEQQMAIALLSALPNLAKEAASPVWISGALDAIDDAAGQESWAGVATEAIRAAFGVETLYAQLSRAGVMPYVPTPSVGRQAFVHQLVSDATAELARHTGLDAAMRHPANAALIHDAQLAGDFGPRHMSYYKLGYTHGPGGFLIDGRTGYDYALHWLIQRIDART